VFGLPWFPPYPTQFLFFVMTVLSFVPLFFFPGSVHFRPAVFLTPLPLTLKLLVLFAPQKSVIPPILPGGRPPLACFFRVYQPFTRLSAIFPWFGFNFPHVVHTGPLRESWTFCYPSGCDSACLVRTSNLLFVSFPPLNKGRLWRPLLFWKNSHGFFCFRPSGGYFFYLLSPDLVQLLLDWLFFPEVTAPDPSRCFFFGCILFSSAAGLLLSGNILFTFTFLSLAESPHGPTHLVFFFLRWNTPQTFFFPLLSFFPGPHSSLFRGAFRRTHFSTPGFRPIPRIPCFFITISPFDSSTFFLILTPL